MSKWFEEIDSKNSNVIYSRVRLARNWDEYVFPSRMTAAQCSEMVERLREGLKGLKDQDGRDLSYSQLDQMQELEKMALRERRILNMACVSRKEPSGLLLSADESAALSWVGMITSACRYCRPDLNWMSCGRRRMFWTIMSMNGFPMPLMKSTGISPPSPPMWEQDCGPVRCCTCPPYPRCESSRALWRI